ncbi:MAG TPA: sugar transferase [Thermomicrobiaceae bacterium]|nr:sugar transferase [Thermomicrobiaceae bacterium]
MLDRHPHARAGATVDPTLLEHRIAAALQPLPATRHDAYALGKRALDIAVATLGLVLLAPLMAVIALLIRLESPGPAFFVCQRVGRYGRPFTMFKFRSMVQGAESVIDLAAHKRPGDYRVTRVGGFMRRTSLDEVPQLINVLRGEMSLVGPRPELPEIVARYYEPWQFERFSVPQGMTGWWQVTGRGSKLMRDHTADDLYYIEHASLRFDLKILALTLRAVLRMDGAF